jgi:hypothetical protein
MDDPIIIHVVNQSINVNPKNKNKNRKMFLLLKKTPMTKVYPTC